MLTAISACSSGTEPPAVQPPSPAASIQLPDTGTISETALGPPAENASYAGYTDNPDNLQNCLYGLTYSCDRTQLSEAGLALVQSSDYSRNLENCLQGLSYSCDQSILSTAELQTVRNSDYQRNFESCLAGLTYSCNQALLSEQEKHTVARSDYARNLQNCELGLTYSCKEDLLSAEDVKRVAVTRLERTVPAPTPPSYGCAENGSCYGDISSSTGRPKTVSVSGYHRKDGTYVRGHYRSRPRK